MMRNEWRVSANILFDNVLSRQIVIYQNTKIYFRLAIETFKLILAKFASIFINCN